MNLKEKLSDSPLRAITQIRKAMQLVFGCDGRGICQNRYENVIERHSLLLYMCSVMYEISDVNDHLYWRIRKINDDSLKGFVEIQKGVLMEEVVEKLAAFRKGLM